MFQLLKVRVRAACLLDHAAVGGIVCGWGLGALVVDAQEVRKRGANPGFDQGQPVGRRRLQNVRGVRGRREGECSQQC